eukprot:9260497-Prorocentrum_lima.AAC.1
MTSSLVGSEMCIRDRLCAMSDVLSKKLSEFINGFVLGESRQDKSVCSAVLPMEFWSCPPALLAPSCWRRAARSFGL